MILKKANQHYKKDKRLLCLRRCYRQLVEWLAELTERLKAKPQWIPCSERLPEEDVEVLVTDDAGGMATIEKDMCGTYENTGERFWYTSQNVTAWMPLPEPYKEGKKKI